MAEPQLWGGRFAGALHPIFEELNRSLPFDRRFVFDDLTGSVAWARGLAGAGVLTDAERDELVSTLEAIAAELAEDASPL
ncbi:MAG: hypothetical protein PVJ89_12855, partial [Planctomycetota bacterium]